LRQPLRSSYFTLYEGQEEICRRRSNPGGSASFHREAHLLCPQPKGHGDNDLAALYRVSTGTFNQAVRRNLLRFPADFMFQLTADEAENLRSQIVISSWGGRRYLPFVFTEQGVAMLSSVLKSDRAIQVNIAIMRAFVNLREVLATHKELALRLEVLEKKFQKHDRSIREVFDAIRALLAFQPNANQRPIGFPVKEPDRR
jgi:hypothetical protein